MTTVILPVAEVPGAAQETTSQSILSAVDNVETLIGSTNTKLDTVIGQAAQETTSQSILSAVDNVETLVGSTNTKLDTVIGHIDGVESSLTTIVGYVDGIEGALTTLNAKDFATTAKQDDILSAVNGVTSAVSTNFNDLLQKTASALVTARHDYFSIDRSDSLNDVYTFRLGGGSGTIVATLSITYTDTTKNDIASCEVVQP